jgi:S-disulfanyl-L-cysteine oxidoreductase SoxD
MRLGAVVASVALLSGCESSPPRTVADTAVRTASAATVAAPAPAATPARTERFGDIGRRASAAEIRAWDMDVNPAGAGLPAGRGTHASGAVVYAQRCASCHGASGEGVPPNPRLVGREPADFSFALNSKAARTIGNYWPYATTLYDYLNRAMPFDAPGSLTPPELYGVVAWLLAENGIVEKSAVIDARSLPKVRMPARDRFVPDNRAGGATFR